MHASIHPSIPPSVPPFLPQLLTHLTATYLSSLRCLPLFVPPTLPPFPLFPPPPPVSLAPSLRRFLFRWTLYPQSCQPSTYQLRAYMPLHVFLLHRASLTQHMLLILRASHTSTSVLFSPGPLTFSPLTPSQHALAPTHTHTQLLARPWRPRWSDQPPRHTVQRSCAAAAAEKTMPTAAARGTVLRTLEEVYRQARRSAVARGRS